MTHPPGGGAASRDSFLSCFLSAHIFSVLLQIFVLHVNASLGHTSPLSMFSPWEISPTRRWSLQNKYISSYGLSWSSDPWFQLPTGFSHQSDINRFFKDEFIIFPLKCFSLPAFLFLLLLNGPTIASNLEAHPSVFPFGMTPHTLNHKIYHVYFLSIFLKDPCLYITQPHYFLPGLLQEPHSWSPQHPTIYPPHCGQRDKSIETKPHCNALLLSVPNCSLILLRHRLDILTKHTAPFFRFLITVLPNVSFLSFLKFS